MFLGIQTRKKMLVWKPIWRGAKTTRVKTNRDRAEFAAAKNTPTAAAGKSARGNGGVHDAALQPAARDRAVYGSACQLRKPGACAAFQRRQQRGAAAHQIHGEQLCETACFAAARKKAL